MKIYLLIIIIAIGLQAMQANDNARIVYPDGSYKITEDEGKSWTYKKAPKVTIHYKTFTKVSNDYGKTWRVIEDIEYIPSFAVPEDHVFVDELTQDKASRYELLDFEGNHIIEGIIDGEYIVFDSSYTGVYFIVLTIGENKQLFKLLF